MWRKILPYIFCFYYIHSKAQVTDSISTTITCSATASGAVTGQKNWNGNTENVLAINCGIDFRYQHSKSKLNSDHSLRGEIGYFKSGHDYWTKSNDLLRLNASWFKKTTGFWNRGFSGCMNTQLLSTYVMSFENGNKTWTGGFMNPINLDATYDFSHSFGKNSRLILSPATISVNASPCHQEDTDVTDALMKTQHSYIRSRYGCSLHLSIYESIREDNILIDNRSSFILNSISLSGITLSIQNRIAIKLLRYLQLRLDTGIQYDPLLSYKMQFRQEILLGMLFQKERSDTKKSGQMIREER